MKTLINLKSTLLVLLFGMTIFSVSAQKETEQVIKSDCQKVEWNVMKDAPKVSSSASNCLVVTLVELDKEQVQNMSNAVKSLSNDQVMMSFSNESKELTIELGPKVVDAEKKMMEFQNCFVEIKKHL